MSIWVIEWRYRETEWTQLETFELSLESAQRIIEHEKRISPETEFNAVEYVRKVSASRDETPTPDRPTPKLK